MIEKEYNLLGLKKSTILYLTKFNNRITSQTVMRELRPEEEKQCDDNSLEYVHVNDNVSINKRHILLYGEVNLNNPSDVEAIKRYCYIPEDYNAYIHSNFNYDKGNFVTIDGIAKGCITFDALLWFKYNYCLIGKPKKIIIFKKYAKY